jgi:hypothetical protein
MTQIVLGPTGTRRRRWTLIAPFFAVALVALILTAGAQAVHDLAFQLDGETTNTAYSAPPGSSPNTDWNDLFNADGSNTSLVNAAGPFTSAGFTRDFGVKVSATDTCSTTNTTSTTFCTADPSTFATGSKDTLDISGWQCNRDHNVNSKIDIMNAYAAAYTASNGDKILYFGMEKNKDNGTNNVGFWFLRGNASCVSGGQAVTWSGLHQVGDVLVVSEFTSGGGVSTITAYRWVGGSTPLLPFGQGGDCKTAPSGQTDSLCATTNAKGDTGAGALAWNESVTTKWKTSDATLGVGNTVVSPDFFEGGINLTKVFAAANQQVPCFSTFIGDTRSSTSLTATLFDFTRGQLGGCETTLATQAGNTANGGAASPTSIGTGSVSSGTDTASLTITGTPTWGGTLSWYLCGPDANLTKCDRTKGTPVTSRTVANNSPAGDFVSGTATLTSVGKYCWTAHFEPNDATKAAGVGAADDDGTNECFTVAPVTPTLTTQASCTSSPCVLGVDTLSDTATLSGTATRPGTGGPSSTYPSINATTIPASGGSISWTLYGPGGNPAGCSNVKLTTSRAVTGDGTYPTAAQAAVSYTPVLADGVGVYTFVASYPSTSVNANAATSAAGCPDLTDTEEVTVIGSANSASQQRWLPNDRVVLTTTGGTLDGTLTVSLYSGTFTGTGANCAPAASATAVPGQSYPFDTSPGGVPDASGTAYVTTNSTFFVGTKADGTAGGAAGNYFWLVHYVDNNLTSPTDRCESSNLTITD